MKLMFRSKIVGIIALILATVVTELQQPASAQVQNACSIALAQVRSSPFDGVNLTPKQLSAYDAINRDYNDRVISRLMGKAKKVIKPDGNVMFSANQGVKIPPELEKIADDAKSAQVPSLIAKYGRYGKFSPETTFVLDRALFEEYERQNQIYQNRIVAIMNPVQQRQYQRNQAAYQRGNKACGIQESPFVKVGNSYEVGGSYF
jgi:hypothetical protein